MARTIPKPLPLTVRSKTNHKSFLYSEICDDLDKLSAHIAFLGIPFGSPYSMEDVNNDQSRGPAAMRQATDRAVRSLERYDFDIGGPLYLGKPIKAVDCGDVPGNMYDFDDHVNRAEQAVRKILKAGAFPMILGGDHAIPIPVLRAFEGRGPITLVQIDAHIDWRDDFNGVRDGLSSTMRRASEMEHISDIFQIGIRAQGSARYDDVAAAKAYGAHLITAYELHDVGMDAILDRIPSGGQYYITIDADGMDPAVMPAVAGPAPGGVTFHQARKLIHGLVNKGRVVGMDIVEITPGIDVNRITAITAARLFVNLIGATVAAGYYKV
jgi:agmatinase